MEVDDPANTVLSYDGNVYEILVPEQTEISVNNNVLTIGSTEFTVTKSSGNYSFKKWVYTSDDETVKTGDKVFKDVLTIEFTTIHDPD